MKRQNGGRNEVAEFLKMYKFKMEFNNLCIEMKQWDVMNVCYCYRL